MIPSVATRLGTYLKKCCDIHIVECIKTNSYKRKQDAKNFLKIFQTDYSTSINKTATESQIQTKRNKKVELPLQADINKLRSFLNNNIEQLFVKLSNNFFYLDWCNLSKYMLCYLQLFNRIKAGEIERLFLTDYNNYQDLNKEKDSVLYNSLTPDEQLLANNFVKINIRGKLGRIVPIIIRKKHVHIIDLLITQRLLAGIDSSNPYIFASPSGKRTYFRACEAMRHCANECGASEPHKLRGTILRKHLATTAQILELGENTMGRLANFMGHDISVHKEHYRLPSTAVDLSQTSKILTIMEGENVEQYRGKSLFEIQNTVEKGRASSSSTSQADNKDIDGVDNLCYDKFSDSNTDSSSSLDDSDTDLETYSQKRSNYLILRYFEDYIQFNAHFLRICKSFQHFSFFFTYFSEIMHVFT